MTRKITLKKAILEYLEALKAQGKTEATLYTYGKDFEQIQAFWGPGKALPEITTVQVGKFLKSRELLSKPNGQARAPQTVQKTIRVLRMFLLWAVTVGYIVEAPYPRTCLWGARRLTKPAHVPAQYT